MGYDLYPGARLRGPNSREGQTQGSKTQGEGQTQGEAELRGRARLKGPNLGGGPDFGIGLSEVPDFEAELSEWSVSGAELKRLYKEAGQLREKVGHLKEAV